MPSRSATHDASSRFAAHQKSTMSASPKSDSPRSAASSARTIAAAAPTSSSVASRTENPSGGDELIERVRQARKVRQLARRRRFGALAEAVDPDALESELRCRNNIVEVALCDVDVAIA